MSLIKYIREGEGLSQEAFAEIVGYGRSTVQRREADPLPIPDFMADVITRFDIDVEHIAEEYAEKARLHLLELCRQRKAPLH